MYSCELKILFIYYFNFCVSFNIDINNPIVYESPNLNNASFFGYSVILYPGNRSKKPWILVGTPRGTNRNNINSGVCYKCGIAEICEEFDLDVSSNNRDREYKEKLDSAWIGASMDINYAVNRIVTCAPRWIKVKYRDHKENDYHVQGACYWFHTNDNDTQKLLPFMGENDIYTHPGGGGSVYYYAQGQAGFSVHMPKLINDSELVMGAPGVYNWDGTMVLYKDNDEPPPIASRLSVGKKIRKEKSADRSEFGLKNIADAIATKQSLAYDLLGYATTSGRFYNESKILYVSSAPRFDYKGQILIYEFDKVKNRALVVKETRKGTQFGEYFGGSLTAGDLNGDGLDDLIVGAPFHSARKYNEGKIYLFFGSPTGRLQSLKKDSVSGKAVGGQFGTTLQYLGDLDHDNFGDIAVAAPYEEENSGVVYIFRGSPDGLDTNYCQRIVGKNIYPNIKGYGISISRAVDMDSNGYPDLAIGAYKSGHVTLLRTRPVVTIYQELIPLVKYLEFKTKKFEMSACYWYELDQLDPGILSINRSLTFDPQLGRAFLQSRNYETTINFPSNAKSYCENFTVSLMDSFSNRYEPITVSLSHKFNTVENVKQVIFVSSTEIKGTDMFCPRCPIYDKYGSDTVTDVEIPFALGCKSGNICKASLKLSTSLLGLGGENIFVIGSKNSLTLQIEIENLGEKAYLTQVLVTAPKIVNFQRTPSACTEKNSSSVLCAVDNPLESNKTKTVNLDFDMTTVNKGKYEDSLIFTIEVLTSSQNDRDKMKKIELVLKREADVTILGKSQEQSYSYGNVSQGKPNFTQTYQVESFGSSPLNEILIEINIPHTVKENGKKIVSLYTPTGFLADQEVTCSSNFTYISEHFNDDESVFDESVAFKERLKRSMEFNKTSINGFQILPNRTFAVNCSSDLFICSKVTCRVGPIKSRQIASIRLKMMLDISAINDILGKKDVVVVTTHGRVKITSPHNFIQSGDKPDTFDVTSLFIGDLQNEEVALWIIIVSAIAGLLLLTALIFALVKVGFFKRTRKEELEQLKKEMETTACENANFQEADEQL